MVIIIIIIISVGSFPRGQYYEGQLSLEVRFSGWQISQGGNPSKRRVSVCPKSISYRLATILNCVCNKLLTTVLL